MSETKPGQKRKATTKDNAKPPKKTKSTKNKENQEAECSTEINAEWKDYELLAEQKHLDLTISQNIVQLFEEGNTIPFIARYRRNATGNMTPEDLREVKECFEDICALKSKICTVVKAVEKLGQLNPVLRKSIASARTIEELEHIYAPYKPGGKRTLAERAKELGLEEPALTLINNTKPVFLNQYVKPDVADLCKLEEVEKRVMHIIAFVISTDTDMLSFLRNLRPDVNFTIETKHSSTKPATKAKKTDSSKPVDESKFETYFDFRIPTKFAKPHQILAINRGESQKVLSVKIVVPDFVFNKFNNFCTYKWLKVGPFNHDRNRIINDAIQDCYTRLIQPLIIREVRSELKLKAEKASYDVFSTNLKHLLLAPPLKGKTILAIDPGFANGCKLAVVSPTGTLLDNNVIYPHTRKGGGEMVLQKILLRNNCDLITLGNGTACRETETWLSKLIQDGLFQPLDVQYTIVNEDGASIYSCSVEAKKEFPDVDPNIISAVSLARRVQEPLAELVKVEPQHLGVGMYQHDLKKKQLEEALDGVVSECVSFVGVDLNTASQCLLRRIAGLSDKRASQIIQFREENGPFTYRKQLTEVKGIGAKIFEQCAGFLRVGPVDSKEAATFYKKPKTNKLDCTYIHPESYDVTKKILKKFKLNLSDVGSGDFIDKIKSLVPTLDLDNMCSEFDCTKETLNLILDTLAKRLNHDLRSEVSKVPLFKKGLTSINDIGPGTELTGRVNNVTHFGCFVDIGVGCNGLIHSSKMNGFNLQIGDRVAVKVLSVEIDKKRISIEALQKL
ncbi:unnamed protein product [Brassicogethes aeneus]|uniref:S1 motif domain-containing protein n=1 Tax=Brassicogethes aeneus TaxID=1431903 RepID=A0A9P0FH63_BRAAE|nr:unnamed protein product [Brassicogethes aeneus]